VSAPPCSDILETRKTALSLGHQLGLEFRLAVAGNLNRHLPLTADDALRKGAIPGIPTVPALRCVLLVSKVIGRLALAWPWTASSPILESKGDADVLPVRTISNAGAQRETIGRPAAHCDRAQQDGSHGRGPDRLTRITRLSSYAQAPAHQRGSAPLPESTFMRTSRPGNVSWIEARAWARRSTTEHHPKSERTCRMPPSNPFETTPWVHDCTVSFRFAPREPCGIAGHVGSKLRQGCTTAQ
jgi:hypothetical protein